MISIVEGPRQCCLTPAANRRQTCCQTRASRRSWSVASQESSCELLRRAKEIQLVLRAHRFVKGAPWFVLGASTAAPARTKEAPSTAQGAPSTAQGAPSTRRRGEVLGCN